MGDMNDLDISSLILDPRFVQCVNEPTRGLKTLDKIITNISTYYQLPTVASPIGASDHCVVKWSPLRVITRKNGNITQSRTTRPMKESDIREFGMEILNCDWSPVLSAVHVNDKCNAFYSILNPLIETYFPTQTVKLHNQDKPWITPSIKSLIQQRQAAFASGEMCEWRRLRNRIIREIKHAKYDFYNNRVRKLKSSNPASWYKQIRAMTSGRNASPLLHIEGISFTDFEAVANNINNFFVNIASDIPRLDTSSLPSFLPADRPLPLIQPWEVYRELKAINQRKAPGPDGISARLVKEFAYELSCPLTDILNASFSQSLVPECWKKAHVVPLPKTF
ncbi:uncharacterized protein LOC129261248 [Lytechinus pictus]|uniref:uncharacterized protein LOC129261248 n=1 Tax=Lytechinus pictus TaxID=7653 RepID=UPI00240DE218|nr:uncharacterized protein LOC129261248 [Lytechinus pictus]